MKTVLTFAALIISLGLAPTSDRLDRAIRTEMTREHVPALTFAVVRHGQIVRTGAYGYANLEWRAPATVDTRFEVASVSKMFVGAAARILVEAGSLDPEDAVSNYLGPLPDAWRGLKVRHLLTMSSGLPEDWGSDLIPYTEDVTTPYDDASMLHAFFTLKMPAAVGERFIYSSPNYAMLAMIVAKISATPFPMFVRQHIFEPAGMTDSSYIDNSAIVPRRAEGYRRTGEGQIKKGRYVGQYLHARPDDGVLTTAPDLAKWLIALQRRKILKAPERLWDPTIADSGRPLDYGYGWMQETWLGHRRVDHSGGLRTGFHSFVARYPDDDLAVVVLTNCDFSGIRNYVNLIARTYLTGVPDPAAERTQPDRDPAMTSRLAAVLHGVMQGDLDTSAIDANATPDMNEVRDFLAHAGPFTYAGRGAVPSRGLTVHGHALVDYETLHTQIDGEAFYLTLYRDASGKIACIELTN